MKITKLVHSCLLIEESSKLILIDPGEYSWQPSLANDLGRLDYLLITHEHPDHFHLPAVQALVAKFPKLTILTTRSLASQLQARGITAKTEGQGPIKLFRAPHAPAEPLGLVPENVGFVLFNKLIHGGDSLDFAQTAPILALPMQSPVFAMSDAMKFVLGRRPQTALPIHDWHWNDEARQKLSARARGFLASQKIDFIILENGKPVDV